VRFLFKPAWLAFIVGVVAFAVACYTLLAPWQFRRNAERERDNAAIATSQATAPVPLAQLVPAGPGAAPAPTQAVEWRRVTVHGHYLPADEAVVRLRSILSDPAYEVLTAFRTDDGRTVAVDRGYIRPVENNALPAYPPAPDGEVTLTARIRLDEIDRKQRPPMFTDGHHQLYSVDSHLLSAVIGKPVAPGYLALLSGQPGALGEVPLPDTDAGPFLSYAWQWLTFGVMALFGLGYFIRLEILQRRPEGGAGGGDDGDGAEDGGPEGEPGPGPDPMLERYGKSRF
jgi:cytochrome oxidase assembly protein ShyY1